MSGKRLIGFAAIVLVATLLATPALAQSGGVGGEGDFQSTGQSGGAAGVTGVSGGVGGNAGAPNRTCECTGGGGGGGAVGAAGGTGGADGWGLAAGAAGGGVGQDGTDGTGFSISDGQASAYSASGGGGGGGAAAGASGASLINSATLTGGNGGKGGNGGVSNYVAGGGGGGGAGSSAFTLTGAGIASNSGSITGGNGGAGGAGDVGGSGGDGGNGIVVTVTGVTINNTGTISGGAGGAGGAQLSDIYAYGGDPAYGGTRGRAGAAGIGGAGIVGAGLTIINSGTIAGGTGYGAGGNAISFTGGANTLTSIDGTLTGNLGLANGVGASLTLAQTSAAGASGDVTISGVTGLTGGATDASVAIKLDGGRSLTITGASTYSGGTSVSDGATLIIGNGSAFGTSTLTLGETLAGVTRLVLNGDGLTIANTIVINSHPIITVAAGNTNTMSGPISGAGDIVLNGGGTLVLSGANTYTGGTTICGTACGVAGSSSVLKVGVDTVGTPGAITSSAIGTGALTFDGGTLQGGGNYTIANAAQINSTGATIDSNGYTFTYSGNIADAAGRTGSLLIKNTNGTVVLSGTNSYSGGTTIAGGTVRATNGSAFGTGTVTLQNVRLQTGGTSDVTLANNFRIDQSTNGSIFDANGKTLTIAGNITDGTGAGKLTITDGSYNFSKVVLLGANTYTGGTTLSAATLGLGDATHRASIVGDINNNGLLYIRNADTSAITSLTNSSSSYTEFSGTTTASAMNISNKGSVSFLDASSAGNATINNYASSSANNYFLGSVQFGTMGGTDTSTAGQASISNGGLISFYAATNAGTATIINAGGSTSFMDQSSAARATITNSDYGATYFGGCCVNEAVTAGNAVITNNDAGGTYFQGSSTAGSAVITTNSGGSTIFYGNATGGDAQFITNGTGYVDFTGSRGANGNGRITAGSIAGSGFYYIGGGNTLVVGSNNLSTTVSGVIADGGSGGGTGASLVKIGTSTLTLSGVNTYTGATTIEGGTLAVNGSILSSSGVTLNAGGTLGGTGIVGNTTIASGGALAPGNSVGTLTVSGNLTFTAGSFYRVEASPMAADRTNVTGTATLAGATVQAIALPGSFRAQTYTILNATGGFGRTQFAGITGSSFAPGARNPHLTYDANNVYLVLDPGKIELPAGTSGNQTSVAGGINNAVDGGATPPVGFDVLLNMSGAQLNRALSQVSGQPGAASTQAAFNAMQQFLGMLDPLGSGTDTERGTSRSAADGGVLGYAATGENDARVREAYAAVTPQTPGGEVIDHRWGVWASGYGGASNLNGNAAAGSSNTTSRIYGTAVGADYRVSPDTLVGFALGGAGFNFSVADSLGSGRADVFQAGLYARHHFGPAYLSAALAYGWQDVTTDRTVTVSGTDKLTANFKASTFAGRLETGWRFAPVPGSTFGVTPYAAVQATTFHLPGYGETALVGSNQFALSYGSQDTTNVRTEFGARTDERFLVENGVLTLRGRLAWAHDSNTNRFVSAAFQMLPGAAFTVSGAQPATDSALVGGRAEMKWRNGLSLAGTVEGEFSRSTQAYTGKGTVRYEW